MIVKVNRVVLKESLNIVGDSPLPDKPVRPKAESKPAKPRTFFRYSVEGPRFRPVGDVALADALAPGIYSIGEDMSGLFLETVTPNTDDMMVFEDSPMHKATSEITKFWERKEQYAQLGLLQSRGLILYGPPGSGKSLAIQQVGEAMARNGDITLFANSPSQISSALNTIRQVEPERRIVVAFEEADELASYDERTLLRLLDGDMKQNNVLYLATTNYIDRLSPRLQRPGRFDKRVHVGPPKFEHRLQYLKHKLTGIAEQAQIQDMAKKTEGMGFGHLRELIAGAFAIGEDYNDVIARLKDPRNIKESVCPKRTPPASVRSGATLVRPRLNESRKDSASRILG